MQWKVKNMMKKDGLKLRDFPEFQNDREIVQMAILQNPMALQYASAELKKDFEIVGLAGLLEHKATIYGDCELLRNREFVSLGVENNFLSLENVDSEFAKDGSIVQKAIRRDGKNLLFADKKFLADKSLVLLALRKSNGAIFPELPIDLREDKEIARVAVNLDGFNFRHLHKSLKEDKSLVLDALANQALVFKFIAKKLKRDIDCIKTALRNNHNAIAMINRNVIDDKSIVLELAEINGMILSYLKQYSDDKDVCLAAVRSNPFSLGFCSPRMREDREIIKLALQGDPNTIGWVNTSVWEDESFLLEMFAITDKVAFHVPMHFRSDLGFMHKMVSINGLSLKIASDDLKMNSNLVMVAVRQHPKALLQSDLRFNDARIVLEAVKKDGNSFQYTSPKLQRNKTVALAAIHLNPASFSHVGDNLRNDPAIRKAFERKKEQMKEMTENESQL